MGWRERDYHQEDYDQPVAAPSAGGVRRPPSGALLLMIVHGVATLLMLMLSAEAGRQQIPLLGLVNPAQHPAGIILHPFATTSLFSGAFAVLALWSLGGRIEQRVGTQRFVLLYVAGNLLAGLAFFVVAQASEALAERALDYPVGALAALCVAAWFHLRHDAVSVFGHVTTAAKMYAVCAGIVILLALLGSQAGAVAWLAAVAGGCAAYPLVERMGALGTRSRRKTVRPSIPRTPPRPARRQRQEPNIDHILAKISESGVDSLTPDEREQLEAARRAKLHGDDRGH